MRVTFANRYVDGDRVYEQGKTYTIDRDKARHLLTTGKIRVADEKKRPAKADKTNNAEEHKDSANDN